MKLTSTETKILELLMRHPGRIFSAEEIYASVWKEPIAYNGEKTVMVHIRRIREKIEINPGEPEYYYVHQYKPNVKTIDGVRLLLAIKDTDVYTPHFFLELDRLASNYQMILFTVMISGGLFVLFGFMSLITGKVRKSALQDCTEFTGNIWLECKLIIIGALLLLCYSFNLWYFNSYLYARMYGVHYLWLYAPMFAMMYILLLDWNHNKGRIFKNSFIYRAAGKLCSCFKKAAWQRKASAMYLAYFISGILLLLSGTLLWCFMQNGTVYFVTQIPGNLLHTLTILQLAAGILLTLLSIRLRRFVSDTTAIANKLTDISTGTPGKELVVSDHSLLKQAAANLNEVEHGIETAVEQNICANRMRVELIINVSHDLKTPLTSIINYADLLCEEKLPEPAREYADALRTKAYRPKGMVQDVFELSKATSGNLPIEKTRLDLAKLVRQTLADMDERIQQSSLTFKLSIVTEPRAHWYY